MSIFFISYQRDSKRFARKLKSKMGEVGLVGWWDEDIKPGEQWKQTIDTMLGQCAAVIVIVTPKSLVSPYVTYEWSFAMGLGKRVIPLLLEKPDAKNPLHPQVHPKLDDFQYRDFTDPGAHPWEQLIGELQEIASREYVPPEIKEARADLSKPDPATRKNAIEFLSRHQDQQIVIEVFAEAVQSGSPDVSMEAALALSRITKHQDVRAIRGLSIAVGAAKQVASQALSALTAMNNHAAIECLLDCYHKLDDDRRRMDILRALAGMTTPDVIPVLLQMLPEQHLPVEVIDALGRFRNPQVIPSLIEYFHRKNLVAEGKVRVLKALGQIGHVDALSPLFDTFKAHTKGRYSEDHQLCIQAIGSIGEIGGDAAIKTLNAASAFDLLNGYQHTRLIERTIQDVQKRMRS